MSKLVGTRIRKEESKHKTEYFPEYCLEKKTWFGKVKQEWYGVSDMSSHYFGEAYRAVCASITVDKPEWQSLLWAQMVIDYQVHYYKECLDYREHEEKKQTTYIKYP